MFLHPSACWLLTVVFACSGGWFLYHCAHSTPGIANRISLLLHAAMCVVMIIMVWPWGTRVPHGPQIALLGSGMVWFAVLAVRARRTTHAIKDAHHAVMAAVMVWMVAMPMPGHAEASAHGGHAAMAQTSGPSPAAQILATYCLVAALGWIAQVSTAAGRERSLHRLSSAAGHAAMTVGTGVLTLAMA
jgi:hypothetical protein